MFGFVPPTSRFVLENPECVVNVQGNSMVNKTVFILKVVILCIWTA